MRSLISNWEAPAMAINSGQAVSNSASAKDNNARFGCLFNIAFVALELVSVVVIREITSALFPWQQLSLNHDQGTFYQDFVSCALLFAIWIPILWAFRRRELGSWLRPAFVIASLLSIQILMFWFFIGTLILHDIASQHVIRHLAPIVREYRAEHGNVPQNVDEILPWYLRPANAVAFPIEIYENKLEYNGDWVVGEDWTTYNIDTNEWNVGADKVP